MRYNNRNPSAHSIISAHSGRTQRQQKRYFMPCIHDCRYCAASSGDQPEQKPFTKRRVPNIFICTHKDKITCTCMKPLRSGREASRILRRSITKNSIKEPYCDKYSCLGKLYFMDQQVQTKSGRRPRNIKGIKEKDVMADQPLNDVNTEKLNKRRSSILGSYHRRKEALGCKCKRRYAAERFIKKKDGMVEQPLKDANTEEPNKRKSSILGSYHRRKQALGCKCKRRYAAERPIKEKDGIAEQLLNDVYEPYKQATSRTNGFNRRKCDIPWRCKRHNTSVRRMNSRPNSCIRCVSTKNIKRKLKFFYTKSQKSLNDDRKKRSPSYLPKIEEITEHDKRKDIGKVPSSKAPKVKRKDMDEMYSSFSPAIQIMTSKKRKSPSPKSKSPSRKKSKMAEYVSDICTRNKCNRRCRAELQALMFRDCTTISEEGKKQAITLHEKGCLKLNIGSQQVIICTCVKQPQTTAQKLRAKIKSICFPKKKKIKAKVDKKKIKIVPVKVTCDVCGCPLAECLCHKAMQKRLKRTHRLLMKERKKKLKHDKKELKKLKKQTADIPLGATNVVADCFHGLFLIMLRGLKGAFKMLYHLFTKPTTSVEYMKARINEPQVTWRYFTNAWRMGWLKQKQRIATSVRGSDSMKILDDTFKDTALYTTFQNKGKTRQEMSRIESENRKRSRRNEKRQNEALYSCRHMFLLTLRNRPCLWVYYICPYLYPQCLSLLGFWKNFTDILLFGLAVLVWSPCIACCELFRGLMCCCLCTS